MLHIQLSKNRLVNSCIEEKILEPSKSGFPFSFPSNFFWDPSCEEALVDVVAFPRNAVLLESRLAVRLSIAAVRFSLLLFLSYACACVRARGVSIVLRRLLAAILALRRAGCRGLLAVATARHTLVDACKDGLRALANGL